MENWSTLKKTLLYFNVSGYKQVSESSWNSGVITKDRTRNIGSTNNIVFLFAIAENIFNWNLKLPYLYSKVLIVCLMVYFVIIDLFFSKDIENGFLNYSSYYGSTLQTGYKIFMGVGLTAIVVLLYNLIGK
jgi:hypothetical protein